MGVEAPDDDGMEMFWLDRGAVGEELLSFSETLGDDEDEENSDDSLFLDFCLIPKSEMA